MKDIIGLVGLFLLLFSSISSATNIGLIENEIWQDNLIPVRFSTSALGDVDGDGDLDLSITGCLSASGQDCNNGVISKIYTNNGSTFIENVSLSQNLTGVGQGSSAWGDIDNDGDLDLITIGCTDSTTACDGNRLSKVYINYGNLLAEDYSWQQTLTAIWDGNIALSDISNDGRLDLALVGSSPTGAISKIYINNGTSFIENTTWQNSLIGLDKASLSFVDLNNDGKIDIGMTGDDESSIPTTKIYINNGSTFLEDATWESNVKQVYSSAFIFGDYDNDNDMDAVLMGCCDELYTYKNNGTTLLVSQKSITDGGDMIGIFCGSMGFGDYDNDGDLDFVITGREDDRNRVYNNNESNGYLFSPDVTAGQYVKSDNMRYGGLAWGDLDKDHDLDLIIVGVDGSPALATRIYINNLSIQNNDPMPPTSNINTSFDPIGGKLSLTWGNGSDIETHTWGLYYNLRVGTCPGCHDIVTGVYGGSSGGEWRGGGPASGYFGNMMQRKSITLNRQFAPGTTIYWAVQTIDTGLAKSAWSTEQVYVIPGGETLCEPEWSCPSWGECQSNDLQSCDAWVDVNNCNETYDGSNTQSCTYHEPSSPGGGSRPSGGSATPPKVEYTFDRIEPGVAAEKEISDGVSISVRVKNAVSKVTLAIRSFGEKLSSFKDVVRGKIYGYLEVNSTGLSDDDIDEAYIEFRINRSWIEENDVDPETIKLNRYENGNWSELETEMVEEPVSITGSFLKFIGMLTGFAVALDDDYYTYRAKTPGFSYFAITGEEKVEVTEGPETVANVSISGKPLNDIEREQTWELPIDFAAVVAIFVAVVAVCVIVYRRESAKPKTLEEAPS